MTSRLDESAYFSGGGDRNTLRRKDGWQVSGTLTTGMFASSGKTVQLQADFGYSDVWTIEFNRELTIKSSTVQVAEALIQWTVEGNTITRRVTIADGASLSGVAQAVRISMYDNSQNVQFSQPIIPIDYGVSCQVARGTRGTNMQPPIFVPTGYGTVVDGGGVPIMPAGPTNGVGRWTVAAGTFLAIPVQADAGIISIFATAAFVQAGDSAHISIQTGYEFPDGSFSETYELRAYDPTIYTSWVPISPGATQVVLAGGAMGSIEYCLTYGIDG